MTTSLNKRPLALLMYTCALNLNLNLKKTRTKLISCQHAHTISKSLCLRHSCIGSSLPWNGTRTAIRSGGRWFQCSSLGMDSYDGAIGNFRRVNEVKFGGVFPLLCIFACVCVCVRARAHVVYLTVGVVTKQQYMYECFVHAHVSYTCTTITAGTLSRTGG